MPQTSARAAAEIFVREKVHALPVLDDENRLVGILTEEDLINTIVPSYAHLLDVSLYLDLPNSVQNVLKALDTLQVRDLMTSKVLAVREDDSLGKVVSLVLNKHINQVPVVKDDQAVGLISRRDIIRILLNERKEEA